MWLWMGDPALADPARIVVDFPYHNDTAHWPNGTTARVHAGL